MCWVLERRGQWDRRAQKLCGGLEARPALSARREAIVQLCS
jgi:hypothetical protein